MLKNIIIFGLLCFLGAGIVLLLIQSDLIVLAPFGIKYNFSKPLEVFDGQSFGPGGAFTFELYREGKFIVDGHSGMARQISDNYSDSAIIRSTAALSDTYKVRATVGEIKYDLKNIEGLPKDGRYHEGPQNENGCYLLAITDEPPTENYTNDWWHKHRKVVIDVDNNVWGHGMPHPIFMVYFDDENELMAYDGKRDRWDEDWDKALTYEKDAWYQVEIEKTSSEYVLRTFEKSGELLKEARVKIKDVWHGKGYPDYFVIGDPHENYYQGSMKIRSISMN